MSIHLLDKMFIKRFCLPANVDIDEYENGDKRIHSCVCGNYNHIACVLQGNPCSNDKLRIISYGVNSPSNMESKIPGLHAEQDAILKLKTLKCKKMLVPINILVVRFSKMNKILSSRPCSNCINAMGTIPQKKGYKIQNIYYSDDENNIIRTNLNKLNNEAQYFSKFYRRKRINNLV